MSRTRLMLGSCFALVLALLSGSCAGTANKTVVPFNATAGAHPKTWLADHWAEYFKGPSQCLTCHGSIQDSAQAGGISKVSCRSCHTKGVFHPADWALSGQHGRLGAELAPVVTVAPAVPPMAGFAHCAKCHGSSYDGGLAAVSCKACHTSAPHPAKPWFDATGAKPSHAFVSTANAPECMKCHAGGANSVLKPPTPAASGTAPGCYNATMCHSTGAHPTTWIQDHWAGYVATPDQCQACHGSTTNPAQAGGISKVSCFSCHTKGFVTHPTGWALPAQHGAQGAMLAPVATSAPAIPVMTGFMHCAKCHGATYGGVATAVSCKSCHTKAPHPNGPWQAYSGSVLLAGHEQTDNANLPACSVCHLHGANSNRVPSKPAPAGTAPGCFNATLCHG
jgi:hypothetical protein